MTREEAIKTIKQILNNNYLSIGECKLFEVEKEAIKVAIEALAKTEAIQQIVDMPFEWEQDDRRRYAKIVDIVRKNLAQEVEEYQSKDNTSNAFENIYDFFSELDKFKKRKEAKLSKDDT